MKKTLINKLDQFVTKERDKGNYLYFSTNVPDLRYKGKKYFIKWHNTHSVFESFKTQKEMETFLDFYLEHGFKPEPKDRI